MADIKITEGSLEVMMRGRTIEDDTHNPHQAVHIQFEGVNKREVPYVRNYVFKDGELKGQARKGDFDPEDAINLLFDFETPKGGGPVTEGS